MPEPFERVDEPLRVVRDDDEIRFEGGDRLDVGREPRQRRLRRALRVVRLVVDGDHLLARADGEQRLRRGRRERDDAPGLLADRHLAVAGGDGHREVRRRSRPATGGARDEQRECRHARGGENEPAIQHLNPPSARGSGVCAERGRSSDSGRPPPPPSRPAGQWRVAGEHLPSQRRDRPGLAPGSLTALRVRADPIIGLCPPTSSALLSALASRGRLGGAHLRALLGARSRHRARQLGSPAAEARARRRVRRARGTPRARTRLDAGRGRRRRALRGHGRAAPDARARSPGLRVGTC